MRGQNYAALDVALGLLSTVGLPITLVLTSGIHAKPAQPHPEQVIGAYARLLRVDKLLPQSRAVSGETATGYEFYAR